MSGRADARAGRSAAARILPAVGLIALTVGTFAPALRNGYVNWDDGPYLIANPLLNDLGGLRRIWTDLHAGPVYYPLVFTTFWIERQLGFGPRANHAVNVLLHALAGLLLWRCLLRLRTPPAPAFVAAAVWLVHPMQVESVVWAVERKNTLAACFGFASALMYLRAGPRLRSPAYAASLALYAAMMLSKTAYAGIVVPMLLSAWLEGRRVARVDLLKIAPFLLVGVLLSLTTLASEQSVIDPVPPVARLVIAAEALGFYLLKLVWPVGLTTIYPRWNPDVSPVELVPLAAAAGGLAAWVAAARTRRRGTVGDRTSGRASKRARAGDALLLATAHYAATLAPALGVIPWPHMDRAFVANHLAYVPLAGPIVLAVLALRAAGARVLSQPGRRAAAIAGCALLIAVLGGWSFKRSLAWRDARTLAEDILRVNPDCAEAVAMRAAELAAENPSRALSEMRRSVELNPRYPQARVALADMLLAQRDAVDEAAGHLRVVVDLQPEAHDARWKLIHLLVSEGRFDEALSDLRRLPARIQRQPKVIEAWAACLSGLGRYDEALAVARGNLDAAPDSPRTYEQIASLLLRLERFAEVIPLCERLLAIDPRSVRAHLLRAQALRALGRIDESERDLQAALRLNPGTLMAVERIRQAFPATSAPSSAP